MEEPHVTIGELLEIELSKAMIEVLLNGAKRARAAFVVVYRCFPGVLPQI
jgi:hypothetical protein